MRDPRNERQAHSALIQTEGGARIDTRQMLATGSIEGPFRRARPYRNTLRMRFGRWLRAALNLGATR